MCVYLNHFAVHQKLTQIVNQLYFNLKKRWRQVGTAS